MLWSSKQTFWSPKQTLWSPAVVPENIKKIHETVLANRKLKLRDIANTVKASEDSVFTILREHLSTRKLGSKWIPRLLKNK